MPTPDRPTPEANDPSAGTVSGSQPRTGRHAKPDGETTPWPGAVGWADRAASDTTASATSASAVAPTDALQMTVDVRPAEEKDAKASEELGDDAGEAAAPRRVTVPGFSIGRLRVPGFTVSRKIAVAAGGVSLALVVATATFIGLAPRDGETTELGLPTPPATATSTGAPHTGTPTPTVSASPTPDPSASPTATASATPTTSRSATPSSSTSSTSAAPPSQAPGPQPGTVAWYLAEINKLNLPAPPASPTKMQVGNGNVYWRINTSHNVIFLTIDDGWVKSAFNQALIVQSGLPFTAFVTSERVASASDAAWFSSLGMSIQNHTRSHPDLGDLSREAQVEQLCTAQSVLGGYFGTPKYYRPPFLEYNDDTFAAARECGLIAGFAGNIAYWEGGGDWGGNYTLQRGDIIVLHFDNMLGDALLEVLTKAKEAGLTPALLDAYVTP